MRMVSVFASEAPGTGGGDSASKYIYFVEPLKSGDREYLPLTRAYKNTTI